MKIYQLHLDGENRGKHNFKNKDEALQHQDRLIRYIRDRIAEGQLGFRQYMSDAKNLQVVEIEIERKTQFFSVVELEHRCCGIVKTFSSRDQAENFLMRISENSSRYYDIMESKVNANESQDYTRKRGDDRGSRRKAV